MQTQTKHPMQTQTMQTQTMQTQTKQNAITRTIIITVEENVDCNHVIWSPARGEVNRHAELAKLMTLEVSDVTSRCVPVEIKMETSMDDLHVRLEYIATKNRLKLKRLSETRWRVTGRLKTRLVYEFPEVIGDGAKFGPVDFYDDVRDNVFAAVRSGLDFSTDWICCKKEPVSCRITRERGKTRVKVSVCGEGDAYGDASVTTQLHKSLTDDQIMCRLERAAHKAWDIAKRDLADDFGSKLQFAALAEWSGEDCD